MFEQKQDQIDLLTDQLEQERAKLAESQKEVANIREDLAIAEKSAQEMREKLAVETEKSREKIRMFNEKNQQL